MTEGQGRATPVGKRKPSLGDVAAHAGVSMQTVSRVANGLTNVGADTRERVLSSMRTLGYRPNGAARALRSGRFRTLGVVTFGLSSYGNMRTLEAIAVAAAGAGYAVTVMPVGQPKQADVNRALGRLSEQAVDGIIALVETHIVDRSTLELPPGLSAVVIDSTERADYPQVDADQAGGARQATEHLLGLGHETVWHIAGPLTSYAAARRETAWRQTLQAAEAFVPEVLRGDWSTSSGYELGRRIASRPDVTAVFAANDQMALGLLRGLHEAGRAVPGDVSVAGFDDMDGADSFWPPLTTVRQDFEAVGARAVELLIREIDGEPDPVRGVLLPTRLVVRGSTGPARDIARGRQVAN